MKYWIKPDIENRIKNGEIKAYFSTEVVEITPDAVVVDTPAGREIAGQRFCLRHDRLPSRFRFSGALGCAIRRR